MNNSRLERIRVIRAIIEANRRGTIPDTDLPLRSRIEDLDTKIATDAEE